MSLPPLITYNHNSRQGRAHVIIKEFSDILQLSSSILDVGCWENDLKKTIGDKVFGIDIAGTPDRRVNLEQEGLPLGDQTFGCVICTDVLEHLNNFHEIFTEMLRVSKKYIILSLPNNLDLITRLRFLFDRPMRFYGLPAQSPSDRHKWLFSYRQAATFIQSHAEEKKLNVVYSFPSFPDSLFIRNPLSRLLQATFPKQYNNLFAKAYWCLIEVPPLSK